ncbi:hypothetical protein ASG67_01765 [Sphingomonas sp. Leaf339]|uniref:helix-turn-helix domain-containing protein n=1 Tax=Sphingomonas sp. Leaf339 TaxID=1736343 RepID=UPI0006F8FFF5|nr:helix-turn-helix domain-containing protein [Sphingomonas sp. Leaf339]KQU61914.1 hypothetical protein ASG67_01765 [Sphingomonas sp. Leaf339]
MNDVEPGDTPAVERVGERLRLAREAHGLSLAEVGQRTRVPLRHLEAIEATDFSLLPSPTYAVGFARAYARAVGADEVAAAQDVRRELARLPRAPEYEPYQAADPTRVPSRGVAIVGLGLALAIMILVGLWYATDLFRPATTAQADVASTTPAVGPVVTVPVPSPTPQAAQVRLAAGDNEVWLRVYDAANATLFLGTLQPGQGFDVPPTANRPMVNVGRPDQLRITVNGSSIPALGDGSRAIKDVPVDGPSLLARASGKPLPAASPTVGAPIDPATAPLVPDAETRRSTDAPRTAGAATQPSPPADPND